MEHGEFVMESSVIPAHSERQAMDWSLVLASLEIPTTIQRLGETSWALVVDGEHHERALEAIRLYRLENRRWKWQQQLPWSDFTFHWGAIFWCLFLVFAFQISTVTSADLRQGWVFSSKAVQAGEWWRVFTAILLHADLPHLVFNAITGFVLFGLAMARFGTGCALFASYLAGAAGYASGLLLYKNHYSAVGASGMVMGALGLIAVQVFPRWRMNGAALKHWFRSLLAGILLFIFLGTSPKTDVVAHLGGFVAGIVLGALLHLLPSRIVQSQSIARGSWVAFVFLLLLPGCLASQEIRVR